MLFVVVYGLTAGCVLPALWVVRVTRRRMVEDGIRRMTQRELRFRMASEFATSGLLLVSALGILWRLPWAAMAHAVGLGMWFYSLLRMPGDLEGRGRWTLGIVVWTALVGGIGSLIVLSRFGFPAVGHG